MAPIKTSTTTRGPAVRNDWQDGDIAFLRPISEFTQSEYDEHIKIGNLHLGAAGHPVVILRRPRNSKYAVVTTVSAYASDASNGYLAPWKQNKHQNRCSKYDFRSFVGSERSDPERPYLKLEGDKLMPKEKTSWVCLQSIHLVRLTTLKTFTRPKSHLRMAEKSLRDLRADIIMRNRNIKTILNDPRLVKLNPPVNTGAGASSAKAVNTDALNNKPMAASTYARFPAIPSKTAPAAQLITTVVATPESGRGNFTATHFPSLSAATLVKRTGVKSRSCKLTAAAVSHTPQQMAAAA
ncbi:uncharacterized protein BCR38DRAFT_490346 [Pseudomassariella vexata]|uniref:Uncharacterized protein n=1 Tax=Pseudomassariella vexata TaxID=1141098 RepID=A0A1Y2DCB0_9PEZI|nr:uncharacterized protein BCR38DRAFT_490346 [Pseudomassariella vexata]ORY56899.1 hypothetical protein BCR38DRAFT_490346 [Pseudomassariella vexata]